jgi:hypothetical protein
MTDEDMDKELANAARLKEFTWNDLVNELERRCACLVVLRDEKKSEEDHCDSMWHYRHGNYYQCLGMVEEMAHLMKNDQDTERDDNGQ